MSDDQSGFQRNEQPSGDEPGGEDPGGRHAHAAHRRFEKSRAGEVVDASMPSQQLHADSPEVLEKLEALDDAVYEAMDGQSVALDRLKKLWPATLAALGEQMVADSREQYLRYAISIWQNSIDSHGIHDPARAVAALDVLCVLFDE
jgi:hypothetical protein